MGIDYDIYIFNSQIYEIKSIVNGSDGNDGFNEVVICRKDHKKFEKDIDPNSDYQEDLDAYLESEPDEINEYQRTFFDVCRIDWYYKNFVRAWEKNCYEHFYKKYRNLEIYKYNVTENNSVFMLVKMC